MVRAKLRRMDTADIVALLIEERDRLTRAIEALQGRTKRAVAPAVVASPAKKKKRRKFSAAQREAAAERMRQRWATKKKADAKSQRKAAGKPKSAKAK